MRTIDQIQQEQLSKLSALDRMQYCAQLYMEIYQLYLHQLSKKNPTNEKLDEKKTRVEIAKRMYRSSPSVLALLQKLDS